MAPGFCRQPVLLQLLISTGEPRNDITGKWSCVLGWLPLRWLRSAAPPGGPPARLGMWLLEKLGTSRGRGALPSASSLGPPPGQDLPDKGRLGAAAFPNVLTPDRIPKFCIPPRLTGSASHQERSSEDVNLSVPSYCPSSSSPHLIQVESAEEIPVLEEESTNSDPRSQAALSLPHFPRAPTSYGFCTLLESPHTRRKESIFHGDPRGSLPSLMLSRSRANTFGGKGPMSRPIAISFASVRLPPQHPALRRQGACDSDTASSSDSSPFSSPLLSRSPPRPCSLVKAQSQEGFLYRALKAKSKSSMARNNSLSTEESSSTDNSPSAIRRASEGLLATRSFSMSCSPIFPLDLIRSRERLVGESTVVMDKGGKLRLSAEYCSENERLRVRLISAEGLYDDSVEPKNINCCITFSLVPGKTQKQRSTVIKRSRNPIFNEDFFFDGIAEEELYSLSVRMKAMNKGCNMKRDYTLGERDLSLMSMLSV
ncbi:C2 calcium-dependent domain-containing protein 4C-like [Falco peregrinus]|uniref:C2 calcium-dependent domain-containing protein 4C-like n=1 Tax=Falco peregrinus TaxID=8954 RepID=UPI00247A5AE5|nr:C2 calcium-dependent domain-containing protein 4C-like [Falco peregrinus]